MAWSGATWIGGTFCTRRSENRPFGRAPAKALHRRPQNHEKTAPGVFKNAGGFAESKLMPPCARQEKE